MKNPKAYFKAVGAAHDKARKLKRKKRIHKQNRLRAAWAQMALDAFTAEVGTSGESNTDLGDLLADLMHWCDVQGIDFEACLNQGREHYTHELERPMD